MINHIVFDFGGVLHGWMSRNYTEGFGFSEEYRLTLKNIIFKDELFSKLATGNISTSNYENGLYKKYPELETDLKKCFSKSINEIMPENKEMVDLFIELSHKGYKTSILSNDTPKSSVLMHNSRFANYVYKFVLSTETHILKPDIAAFENMLKIINAKPEEVLFVDDKQRNIDAAKSIGINTVLCTDICDACKEIKNILKSNGEK